MLAFRVMVKSDRQFYTVHKINFIDKEVTTWNKPISQKLQTVRFVERNFDDVILYQSYTVNENNTVWVEVDLEESK